MMKLCEVNQKLNPSKCEFAKTSIGFLGHVVNREGTQLDQKKVKIMIEYPMPILIINVKAFLGLIGYYHNYVKGSSHIATPLFELTKKDNVFSWTP
jgi:hypothetical protein